MSVYDFTAKTNKGEEKSLAEYKGKVLIIVNTASKCGFTPQYEELEELYKTYGERGLVVLGFPATNSRRRNRARMRKCRPSAAGTTVSASRFSRRVMSAAKQPNPSSST